MCLEQLLFGALPRRVTLVVDGPPVFLIGESRRIAIETSQARAFPRFDVHRQLPDRMSAGNRMRCGLLRSYSIQQRQHRWSMPRFTLECATKLILDTIYFTHIITPFTLSTDYADDKYDRLRLNRRKSRQCQVTTKKFLR